MRKMLLILCAGALVAGPAAAVAGPGHYHAYVKRVRHAIVHQARQACQQERQSMGVDAFRAKYGTPNAFRKCVRQHALANLAKLRQAIKDCRAERRADPAAFKQKYGGAHPLVRCVKQEYQSQPSAT